MFYSSINCKSKMRMSPGIPKKPTIKAVTGLIATLIPNNPPTRFNNQSIMPPIIALYMNFKIIRRGTSRSHPTTYNSTNPKAYANTTSHGIVPATAITSCNNLAFNFRYKCYLYIL